MRDHVIICGLGEIGFHVFTLLQRAGIQTTIISNRTHEEWIWQIQHSGNIFIYADARDDNVLLEAGIKEAKALIVLTNNDHVNFSIAIDAKKLNANIKIISRIYDTELGNLVAEAFGIEQVFSTSELTSSLFINNLTDKKILGQFLLNDKLYVISETSKDFPDKVMLLEKINNLKLIAEPVPVVEKKPSKSKIRNIFRNPNFIFFGRFLTVIFFITLFSTLLIAYAMPLSIINAIYFVITTITSVGYGDLNFLQASVGLKLFGCLLMLTGTTILAVLFSLITEIIIIKRLPNLVGGFPVPKKNHVILIGANHVGIRIINHLVERSAPTVSIESQNEHFPEDISRQTSIVSGNPSSTNTLRCANIQNAKAIIAVTKNDIENLSIGLAAKKLNPNIIELIQINSTQIGEGLKKALTLTNIFSAPFITAPYFVAATMKPQIIFAIEWQNKLVYISSNNQEIMINSISLQHDINSNI
jgi:Trk K+ transport system NAD-binding subunit